jgi:acetyltransferase-like isoleucine patch superfamily enzyme
MHSFRLYVYNTLSSLAPPTRLFGLKRFLLRWAGAKIGSNVRIVSSARFLCTGALEIGDNTWVGHEVLIVGGDAAVRIGRDVDIGPRVTLVTGGHEPHGLPGKAAGRGISSPITIGDGAWVGASATLLGGVSVGSCGLIAAGALVRADVAAGQVVGGVPAHQIGARGKSDE